MNEKNTRGITIAALVIAVLALSIGFAAFSSTLNITSGASVDPLKEFYIKFADTVVGSGDNFTSYTVGKVFADSASTGVGNSDGAIINNNEGTNPVISDLTASFTAPGQSVVYSFYVVNDSNYTAYLNQIEYMSGKTCTSDSTSTNPATQALVDEACSGITSTVTVGNSTEVPQTLGSKEYRPVVVTISYNGKYVDGAFKVKFGDIKLHYGSVVGAIEDDNLETTTYYDFAGNEFLKINSDGTAEFVAMGGMTGTYVKNDKIYTINIVEAGESQEFKFIEEGNYLLTEGEKGGVYVILSKAGFNETLTGTYTNEFNKYSFDSNHICNHYYISNGNVENGASFYYIIVDNIVYLSTELDDEQVAEDSSIVFWHFSIDNSTNSLIDDQDRIYTLQS